MHVKSLFVDFEKVINALQPLQKTILTLPAVKCLYPVVQSLVVSVVFISILLNMFSSRT